MLFQLLCCRSNLDLINTSGYSFACPSWEELGEQRKVGTKGELQLGGLAVAIVSQREPLCICAHVAIQLYRLHFSAPLHSFVAPNMQICSSTSLGNMAFKQTRKHRVCGWGVSGFDVGLVVFFTWTLKSGVFLERIFQIIHFTVVADERQ